MRMYLPVEYLFVGRCWFSVVRLRPLLRLGLGGRVAFDGRLGQEQSRRHLLLLLLLFLCSRWLLRRLALHQSVAAAGRFRRGPCNGWRVVS